MRRSVLILGFCLILGFLAIASRTEDRNQPVMQPAAGQSHTSSETRVDRLATANPLITATAPRHRSARSQDGVP